MNNLHISLTNLTNESRLLKETLTISQKSTVDYVYIAALWEDPLNKIEELDSKRVIHRFDLKSRKMPKNLFSQLFKYCEFAYKLLQAYRFKKIKIVNIHSLILLPIGVLFKKLYNTVLIYDAHELETEAAGLIGLRKKLAQLTEKIFIPYCDRIIVVSESIADEYLRLYPLLTKPSVVLNTPPLRHIEKKNIFREVFNIQKDQTIFLYQGGLSEGRGIEILLETFQTSINPNHVIIFMGYGPLTGNIQEAAQLSNRIFYHPAVSPNILLEYTSSADIGISMIENTCLSYAYCLPNKMFEYIMAGLPIIVSNLFEMAKIVNTYKIGVVAEENSAEGLLKAIKKIEIMDLNILKNNIKIVQNLYNWQQQEKILLEAYDAL